MRVNHCGGFAAFSEALAAAESGLGINSKAVGGTPDVSLFRFSPAGAVMDLSAEIAADRPDVLVVHGALALAGAFGLNSVPAMERLRELRGQGTRIVYWSQGNEPFSTSAQRAKAKLSEALFAEVVDHVLLSSLEPMELARLAKSYSWLALPAPLAMFEGAGAREYGRSNFHFTGLLVPFQLSPAVVKSVEQSFSSGKSLLKLSILPPESVTTFDSLRAAIEGADLVIDCPDGSNYGPLGILSLAAGRPLFAGAAAEVKKEWPSQELSPVIGIEPSSIAEKVRHILMEPRMLRDLGKRSRNFALERHHPSRVAPLTLQLYQRLLGQ